MAATTIEWTRGPNGEQGYTFNPWWGCAEISPACAHCYARTLATRVGHPGLWSPDGKRRFFGNDHWTMPLKLDARARHRGERYRVFCASMADVFDNHPDVEPHRQRLWNLIACTPHLDWLLLSKRIGNAKRMLPADWGDGYRNVWLGSTVVTQQEVDRDVPKLLSTPARVRFLSCEPLIEQIDLTYPDSLFPNGPQACCDGRECGCMGQPIDPPLLYGISWVIAGGESGPKARPMHVEWVRSLRDQCVTAGVPFHFKQWGEWLPGTQYEESHRERDPEPEQSRFACAQWDGDKWDINHIIAGDEYDEHALYRIGKKAAGRMLDGRTWDEFPEVACTA